MRSKYLALAVVLSFLCFSFAFAQQSGRTITGTTQTTSRIQPVISAVQTKIIPKLVAKGKQLFLELSQNVKKIDVLSGGRLLGSLGSGNSFDVTQFLTKAVGNKLSFNMFDANNKIQTQDFDISQWKNLVVQAVTPVVEQAKARLDQGIAQVSKAALKASVDITSPNEGETWETGLPYTISWDSFGIPAANCEAKVNFGCVDKCGGFSCIGYGVWCIKFHREATVTGKPQGSVKLTMVDSTKIGSNLDGSSLKEGDLIDHLGVAVTIKNTATHEEYSVMRKVKLKMGPPKPATISPTGLTPAGTISTAAMEKATGQPEVSLQVIPGSVNFTAPAEDGDVWECGKTYTVSWQSLVVPNDAKGNIYYMCPVPPDPDQNPYLSSGQCHKLQRTIQSNAPVSGSVQFTVPHYFYGWIGDTLVKPPHLYSKPVVMQLRASFVANGKAYNAVRKVKVKTVPW